MAAPSTRTLGSGQLLADVQVLSLGAGQTINSVSGQTNTVGSGVVQMTPNSVGNTQPTRGYRWDVTQIEVFPGTLAPGQTEPDLWCWVRVDGQSYQQWFLFDCSISGCMLPRPSNTVGYRALLIGESMLAWALKVSRGAAPPRNMPSRFTGLKVSSDLTFFFFSAMGFTAATFIEPPTLRAVGDVYDAAAIQLVAQSLSWNGAISEQTLRRALAGLPAYTAQQTGGTISLQGWQALSGGPFQGLLSVYRYLGAVFNGLAAVGTQPLPLTATIQSVGGKPGTVPQNQADFGWDFTGTANALKIIEIGRRPGAGAGYFGLTWGNGLVYPNETAYGLVCTPGHPRVPFGAVQPLRPESNLWYAMRPWGDWAKASEGPELIAAETVAPYIAAQNGATIAANTDETAIGGVRYITGVPQGGAAAA